MKTSIIVDKLKVRMAYKYAKGNSEYQQLNEWKLSVMHEEYGSGGKFWKSKIGPFSNVSVPLSCAAKLYLKYGYSRGCHYSWLKFNPAKLDDEAAIALEGHLNTLFEHGPISLVTSGVVTEIDVALDVEGARFSDHILIDPALRASSDAFAYLGTSYIGSRQGNRSFRFYDKRKEIVDNGGIDTGVDKMRIEAILRGARSFAFSEIASLPNPFCDLLVVPKSSIIASKEPCIATFWAEVASSSETSQATYSKQTKAVRKKLRLALKEIVPTWWKPNSDWPQYLGSFGWLEDMIGSKEAVNPGLN